jgi:hypothetical protein
MPVLNRALRFAALPALISLFVTLARFFGERAELPSPVTFVIGIFWLTLVVAFFWGFKLASEVSPYRLLFVSLLVFAVLSRIPVIALWWITRTYGLGTHYDVSGGWGSALFAQLVIGTLAQIVAGGLLGAATLAVKRSQPVEEP